MPKLVDVYPYRLVNAAPEFLVLKRAADKRYAGQWRMVAGKVEHSETSWQAGLRELREETGIFPVLYWAVPSINQFYETEQDIIHHIPVFAAEITPQQSIKLNEEHTQMKWITSAQITTFIGWPEQRRLISLINTMLTTQNILDEWKIPL